MAVFIIRNGCFPKYILSFIERPHQTCSIFDWTIIVCHHFYFDVNLVLRVSSSFIWRFPNAIASKRCNRWSVLLTRMPRIDFDHCQPIIIVIYHFTISLARNSTSTFDTLFSSRACVYFSAVMCTVPFGILQLLERPQFCNIVRNLELYIFSFSAVYFIGIFISKNSTLTCWNR